MGTYDWIEELGIDGKLAHNYEVALKIFEMLGFDQQQIIDEHWGEATIRISPNDFPRLTVEKMFRPSLLVDQTFEPITEEYRIMAVKIEDDDG